MAVLIYGERMTFNRNNPYPFLLKKLIVVFLLVFSSAGLHADRVKDIASFAAARSNQLIGYGLVVGLQGTGDGASIFFTTQSLASVLGKLGVSITGQLADFEAACEEGNEEACEDLEVMLSELEEREGGCDKEREEDESNEEEDREDESEEEELLLSEDFVESDDPESPELSFFSLPLFFL